MYTGTQRNRHNDLFSRRDGGGAKLEEMIAMLKGDVLAKVSREIVLDADEGIDYAVLGDGLLSLLPVELLKMTDEETEPLERLNVAVDELAALLLNIAELLDRRHADEEYIKLYEDELKKFLAGADE